MTIAYDVNTNTNYNPAAEAKVGASGMGAIADYLTDLLNEQYVLSGRVAAWLSEALRLEHQLSRESPAKPSRAFAMKV